MIPMTGRQRLLTTIGHEEPDRVPISPRVHSWLVASHGDGQLQTQLRVLPHMDLMHIVSDGTANYVDSHPDEYDLPEVQVDQRRSRDGDLEAIERTFHTPAGRLSDRILVAPPGREYGVSPNPVRTEHLVKERSDLAALQFILRPLNTDFSMVRQAQAELGDRGVVMVCVRSSLDHNAGYARDMADLMVDYYQDRALLDELIDVFQQRSLAQIRAALEDGVEFIFGSWYFNSLSAGWSPAILREIFVPQLREHVELTHGYGAYYDYYDDGRLADSMEMICATGVDVLETCTPPPVGDFDLALAKQLVGDRTTIKGYVDLLYVVKHGTAKQVTETVAAAMETAKSGGGFIIGSSDSFREGTPQANIDAYFAACLEHGRY
jgi:uroporphyrinogen decarboxylase